MHKPQQQSCDEWDAICVFPCDLWIAMGCGRCSRTPMLPLFPIADADSAAVCWRCFGRGPGLGLQSLTGIRSTTLISTGLTSAR